MSKIEKRVKKRIDNVVLEGWEPTPLEQSLMDGTFEQLVSETDGTLRMLKAGMKTTIIVIGTI